ncbi:TetR/AcrR family transcriptional regulator [Actinomadura kijaniata]|uniref:TetR/AcrR family transcriptional regulator n=1 Tax=Actinomadura kijaniata TaxID=46161 RepID=UPI00082F6A6A|nr:TetR/AcrR family transcriptional regulator [Actinomadura kijaniata]
MESGGAREWLAEGLRLLAEQGAPAVTLERVCERMGMSKGAFYHHFGSVPKFRTRLLAHFEAEYTTAVIDAVEGAADLPARERLDLLVAEALRDTTPDLEIAVRAWAKQDPEAAAVQERVDATRVAYVRDLCERAGHADPDRTATLVYLVLIGGAHLAPPLPHEDKRALCALVLGRADATAAAPERSPAP